MNKITYDKMIAIDRVISRLRHDLSNMINGITGFAEVISFKSEDRADIVSYCNRIMSSSEEIFRTLTDVLRQPGSDPKKSGTPDTHNVLENTTALLSYSLGDNITIKSELTADRDTVKCAESDLQSILLSLGTNAGEAMPDGGVLEFRTSNIDLDLQYCDNSPFALIPGEYIKIEVSDTGSGSEFELADRFFEPYYTTTGDRKRGLGLTKAFYKIITIKGEIDLTTAPGRGTTVTLLLPIWGS